ncbi:hypothetical protein [Streptomyces sp. NPDC091416]|uniref:hypothetical protein n=1 Tax=Streptomyces sp. NPDC091416 TaxID=3366003 RepID=UPI0037F65D90
MAQVTASEALTYSIKREQAQFAEEAERLAAQVAYIATNPPTDGRTVSGDITRLIQEATFLLKRAVTIEAGLEAVGLICAETVTPEQ